jgi:glutamate racemase
MTGNIHPIGVFDSGIGGLSVANAIYKLLPNEQLIYFADTAHVPYGPRSRAQIQTFSEEITTFLLSQSCKMIVVACNTATSAALEQLRQQWPDIPFVGMEPAVKPAAKATVSCKVGVLATAATIKSERYAQLMERYASGVEVFENPCVGLVPQIEAAQLDTPETERLVSSIVNPMLDAGVDTLVLGCTHYPFIQPLLRKLVGDQVQIIDPAPAVARQVERRLEHLALSASEKKPFPAYHLYASGSVCDLTQLTEIPFQLHTNYDLGLRVQ